MMQIMHFMVLSWFLLFHVSLVTCQANFERTQEVVSKDLIIEDSYQCKCVPYYLCSDDNYIITDGAGIFDPRIGKDGKLPKTRIKCTNEFFVCCKEKNSSLTVQTKNPTIDPNFPTTWKNPNQTRSGCGYQRTIINPRIIPDDDFSSTIIGEIAWIVAIFKEKSSRKGNYDFKCSGSLIRPNVALTATHCVVSSSANALRVALTGESLLKSLTPNDESESKRNVLKIIKHPNYYSGGLHNDIALLILDRDFDFKNMPVNSVCLPENENQNFVGSPRCIAAGWGTGKINDQSDRPLRKVTLPIIDFNECQNSLRSRTRLGADFQLHSSFMCAGGEPGVDTCQGDGGGPLMCPDENNLRYVQVGIVSWGIDCGKGHVPGVYTDIRKFVGWIDEALNRENIQMNQVPKKPPNDCGC